MCEIPESPRINMRAGETCTVGGKNVAKTSRSVVKARRQEVWATFAVGIAIGFEIEFFSSARVDSDPDTIASRGHTLPMITLCPASWSS
jgi:hypothetical protein